MSKFGRKKYSKIDLSLTSSSLLNYISLLNDPCNDFYYFSCEGWIYRRHLEALLERKIHTNELYEYTTFYREATVKRKYDNESRVIKQINDMYNKCSTLEPELLQICYSSVSDFGTYAYASYFINRLENTKRVQDSYKIVEKMFHEIIDQFKILIRERKDILDNSTIKNYNKKVKQIKFSRKYHKILGNISLMKKCYSFFKFSNNQSGQVMLNNIFNYESSIPKSNKKLRKQCINYIVHQNIDKYSIYSLISYNAHFHQQLNNIIINPSILVDPCFDPKFPMSLNYGCVGTIIGHEIVHAFDSLGIHFDNNGMISQNVTSKTSRKKYKQKSDCISKQYTNETLKKIGANYRKFRILNENIADNGGIKISYRAYQKYLEKIGGEEPKIPRFEKFNSEQLFFINFARFFCSLNNYPVNMTTAHYRVHFPGRVRITNTLSNYKPFSKAFKCKVGSKMNPENKCEVWL